MPQFRARQPKPVGRRSGRERDWTWTWEPPLAEGRPQWRRLLWPAMALSAIALGVGLTLAFTLAGFGRGGGRVSESIAVLAANVSLTVKDGQPVVGPIFQQRRDVYLLVEPTSNTARLPDGDYVFQVTDVSGKVLLSPDEVRFRQFRVADGSAVGVSGDGRHAVGTNSRTGAATIQLHPFSESPDRSGVYQAWITRVEDFQGDVNAIDSPAAPDFHGFLTARSLALLFAVTPAR